MVRPNYVLGILLKSFHVFFSGRKKEEIPILFEDDFIIAINKPVGVTSAQKELEKLLGKKILLIHRLDKLTSGLLLLAKTKGAQRAMEKLFFDREIEKHYLAIVHGRLVKNEGVIEKPLCLKKRYEGGVLYKTALYGKSAKTEWKKVVSSNTETLLLLRPITGRTHQLRVHLDSIERPIMGDPQYGDKTTSTLHVPRLMLHARKISFIHPILHKKIEIIAPIPIIIRQTISKLFKKQKKCGY
ncbi:MAG: Dual-specificity RNA pseudouridine synthase RluA [Chlamydiae bacterium]|nr:Dual-specificity RNA pseudouridine synthase RluA [Chlamydiota bacterium]